MIRHELYPIILTYGMILNHLHRLAAIYMIDNRLRRGGVGVVGGVGVGATLWCYIASVVHNWRKNLKGVVGRLDIHITAQNTCV